MLRILSVVGVSTNEKPSAEALVTGNRYASERGLGRIYESDNLSIKF